MYDDIYTNLSDSLTNFVNALQLQPELASQALIDLSVSAQESIYNISSQIDQIITTDLVDQLSIACDSISQLPIFATDWINQLSAVYDSMAPAIEFPFIPFDDLSFLKGIDLQQEYIDLTDDDCNSINTILQSPNVSNDTPPKVSKGKMAISDFIKTILFPLFLTILQMLHGSYCNKLASVEAQKTYIEEQQLQEEEIQLLKEQIQLQEQQIQIITGYTAFLENTLNELIDYANSQEYLQETQKPDSDLPKPPMFFDEDLGFPDEVPHCSPEVPHSPDDTQDND